MILNFDKGLSHLEIVAFVLPRIDNGLESRAKKFPFFFDWAKRRKRKLVVAAFDGVCLPPIIKKGIAILSGRDGPFNIEGKAIYFKGNGDHQVRVGLLAFGEAARFYFDGFDFSCVNGTVFVASDEDDAMITLALGDNNDPKFDFPYENIRSESEKAVKSLIDHSPKSWAFDGTDIWDSFDVSDNHVNVVNYNRKERRFYIVLFVSPRSDMGEEKAKSTFSCLFPVRDGTAVYPVVISFDGVDLDEKVEDAIKLEEELEADERGAIDPLLNFGTEVVGFCLKGKKRVRACLLIIDEMDCPLMDFHFSFSEGRLYAISKEDEKKIK